jgi:hypothetical protein
MTIRIIKHEAVPQTGSYEVRFSDELPASTFTGTTFRGAGLTPNRWIAIAPQKPPRLSREANGTKSDEQSPLCRSGESRARRYFQLCVVKRMIARAILHAQRAIDVALGAQQVNVPTEQ